MRSYFVLFKPLFVGICYTAVENKYKWKLLLAFLVDGDDVDEHNGGDANSNTPANEIQVLIHFYYTRLQIIFYG